MQQNKNQHGAVTLLGFTLLELLIVVAIIGIISSVILASSGNARTEKEVESATREVTGLVREAQQYALTGKQFVADTSPCQFTVGWNSGSNSVTTNYYYKGNTGVCDQSVLVGTSSVRGGVVFANSGSIAFTPPHGKPSFATASEVMILSKAGILGVACVYQNGLVKNILNTNSCP